MTFITNLVNETYNNSQNLKMRDASKEGAKGEKIPSTLDARSSIVNSINIINIHRRARNEDFMTTSSTYFDGKVATGYRNPTGTDIVNAFNGSLSNVVYKPEDFIFLEDYGKLPNNHLITLRRFPSPCFDDIYDKSLQPLPDVGRVLSYIDGENNKMEELFGFSAGFNFKEMKSEIQTINRNATGGNGTGVVSKVANFVGKTFDTSGTAARENLIGQDRTNFDPYDKHQDNYTWGPIDVIDSINIRERGLTFDQEFKIKFRYTVRSYNGISTKMVFMDILGNMLQLITNKAPFWGGAVRFQGGKNYTDGIFDFKKLETGDFAGFLKGAFENIASKISNPFKGGAIEGLKTLATNIGTGLIGGQIDKLGRPEMYGLHSLLQGQSTGEWHLTLGNPFNPTMVIGNLYLSDSNVSFEGPFTIDDVPSTIILEVTLKHGMPRDKFAIQSMFNAGKGRYYSSDIDGQTKSYYRNKDAGMGMKGSGNGGSRSGNQTVKLFNNAVDTTEKAGNDTIAYAKALYSQSAEKTF